ncbi:hypothetical protein N0V90_001904 [Kalmusia sp. IMI 367209]|nr:hypothetical protein N0V90_001904 [Kalmusia sp. IMI 367209]
MDQERSLNPPVCNIVTPVGMLGYGLDEALSASLITAVLPNGAPTAIILDSGSTDSGPEKLALGCMTSPRTSYVRDLTKLVRLAWRFKVPLIFSSAGGDGSDEHVDEMVKILQEICEENEHYKLKVIAIYSELTKSFVYQRLQENAITGCGPPVPPLTAELIDSAPRIASQMGPEPFYDAMNATPDFNVLVGGRAYDPSPYVAYAAYASKTPLTDTATPEAKRLWGGFTHMGKILECGGSCATPKCATVRATVYQNGTFDLTPGESGTILIGQLDFVLKMIKQYVAQQHAGVKGTWDLDWHIYGQHQTTADGQPAEVLLIGEALASTQELANSVASTARIATVHAPYPNQKATSGNLAYGLGGKMESELGPCAQFSIYHLVGLEEGEERLKLSDTANALYWQRVVTIGRGASQTPQQVSSASVGAVNKTPVPPALLVSSADTEYPASPKTLGDIARVLRSKNAGPYEITFDVMFANGSIFQLVKSSGFLNAAAIAKLNGIGEDEVIWSGFFDQALAYKATIPRLWRGKPTANGGFMESDVHGSQKYIGLLNMPLPKEFMGKWEELMANRREDSGVDTPTTPVES